MGSLWVLVFWQRYYICHKNGTFKELLVALLLAGKAFFSVQLSLSGHVGGHPGVASVRTKLLCVIFHKVCVHIMSFSLKPKHRIKCHVTTVNAVIGQQSCHSYFKKVIWLVIIDYSLKK